MKQFTIVYTFEFEKIICAGKVIDDGIGTTAASKVAVDICTVLPNRDKKELQLLVTNNKDIKNGLFAVILDDQEILKPAPEPLLWEIANKLLVKL